MSTADTKRDPVTDVCVAIARPGYKAKVANALPASIPADRFIRVATTAVQMNPDVVLKGTKASVLTSLIRCAQDGLLPDGKEAALALFGNAAVYLPMIGGFRKKAAEHGFSLTAQVVHAGDDFDYTLGLAPTLTHKPPKLDVERGDPIGAYAVAAHQTHGVFVEVMSKQEIEQVRNSSRAKGSGPWAQWWGEMARKTVARRLFKMLPLGALDERAVSMLRADDETYDLAAAGPLDDLPRVDPSEPEVEEVEGELVDEDEALFQTPQGVTEDRG